MDKRLMQALTKKASANIDNERMSALPYGQRMMKKYISPMLSNTAKRPQMNPAIDSGQFGPPAGIRDGDIYSGMMEPAPNDFFDAQRHMRRSSRG